jgi:hypothetical protein
MSSSNNTFTIVKRDRNFHDVKTSRSQKVPRYRNLGTVRGIRGQPGMEGNIIFNRANRVYYGHNGRRWVPLSTASGAGYDDGFQATDNSGAIITNNAVAGVSASGANSIAAGANSTAVDNSIVINASGTTIGPMSPSFVSPGGLYIKPIRLAPSGLVLHYDSTTGEVTHGGTPSGTVPDGGCQSDYLYWDTAGSPSWAPGGADVHIGCDAAADNNGVALGFNANAAGGNNIVAVGAGANSGGNTESVAVGFNVNINDGNQSIGIGRAATIGPVTTSFRGIAIGSGATVNEENSIALGYDAFVYRDSEQAIAIGPEAWAGPVTGAPRGIAIGAGATIDNTNAIAIGNGTIASQTYAVALGNNPGAPGGATTASGNRSLALGTNTQATMDNAIALGNGARATADYTVAIGGDTGSGPTTASADYAAALGSDARALGSNSLAMGHNAVANIADSIAIGVNTSTTMNDAIALGNGVIANKSGGFFVRHRSVDDPTATVATFSSDELLQSSFAIAAGTTPGATLTVSNIVNITMGPPTIAGVKYMRIGSVVTLSFAIEGGFQITGSGGSFQLSGLPGITANFTDVYGATGVMTNDDTNNQGAIQAVSGTQRLLVLIDTDLPNYTVNHGKGMVQYLV